MVSKNRNAAVRETPAPRRGGVERPSSAASGLEPVVADEDDESTEALLRHYRRLGSLLLRDRLVERHRGIVESIARGLAARLPPSVDVQDLVHAGMWGLMQAIDSYQPERCDQFTAFLRIRARGAMLDELRHMDFLPRLFRRRLRERDAAAARLRGVLEREPTDAELAAELGVSPTALWRRYESLALHAGRGGEADEGDGMEQIADGAVEPPFEGLWRRELLELVRQSLQPIEWKVLQLHYLEGMTGKQVARRLRLSAARICQIHGRVLDRLKAQLATVAAV